VRNLIIATAIAVMSFAANAAFVEPYAPVNDDHYAYWVDSSGATWRSEEGCARTVNELSYTNSMDVALQCGDAEVQTVSQLVTVATTGGWVHFDFDSAALDAKAYSAVSGLAGAIGANEVVRIDLVGNTDAVGTDAYNMELGFRRAVAVATLLDQFGIKAYATSDGERHLVVNTEGPSRANRRVDVDATWKVTADQPVRVQR